MHYKNERIEIIDFLRGTALILMVIYHTLYDLKYMFGVNFSFFSIKSWYFVQQFICWTFIFLSGFSVNLSKNPFKNAMRIIFFSLVITLVTSIVTPDFSIKFGVLHLIGASMLIVSGIKDNEKGHFELKFLISFFIFFLIWKMGLEKLSFFGKLGDLGFLFPIGFYGENFSSSDYFPMLPWFFLFLSGFYLGKINFENENFLKKLKWNTPINVIGGHTLIVYLLHQIVIYLGLTFLDIIGII